MEYKDEKKPLKEYRYPKRKVLLKIVTFLEVPIAIFIILVEKLCNPFIKLIKSQKTSKIQKETHNVEERQNVEEKPKREKEVKEDKKNKSIKVPLLLKKRLAFVYIIILIFIIACGSIYALLTDKALAETNLQVGSLLVKLEEDEPFNKLESIPIEGASTNNKVFRAISICTLDMYVRVRIIPIIERYDEKEGCYIVIPIDINDVKLNIQATDWTYSPSDEYYYYNNILKPEGASKDINITVLNIANSDDFQNTNIRVTLRVELEATQVNNDVWKQIFNIETLPFGI